MDWILHLTIASGRSLQKNEQTDLIELFWTKRFAGNFLGKEFGHAEEAVQRRADSYAASPN